MKYPFFQHLVAGAASLLLATPLLAQVRKLNGSLPPGGDVLEYAVSPDGSRVVYRADQANDEVFELFSVPVGGGAPVKLNGALVTNGDVVSFACSPDSTRVVYQANQDSSTRRELYSAPIDGGGGGAVKLNLPLGSSEHVNGFEISPDSSFVLYRAGVNGYPRLFSVPIDGGTSVALTPDMFQPQYVSTVRITPDGSLAVYAIWYNLGPPTGAVPGGIASVPCAGGATVFQVSGEDFLLAPDGQRAVFTAGSQHELFRIPAAGGSAVQISLPLGSGGTVGIPPFRPTPSSPYFYGSISACAAISPDSGRVVYTATQSSSAQRDLYSVPIGGGTSTKLNPTLVAGGGVGGRSITPDSTRVLYVADQEVNDVFQLYSVALGGGPATRLNTTLAAGHDVLEFVVSPSSEFVVYRAGPGFFGSNLYRVSTAAGPSFHTVNGPLVVNGAVTSFTIDPQSQWVVYEADQGQDERFELYASPATGDFQRKTARH